MVLLYAYAGITFAGGTPGSATVSLNAENEASFSISDAQGRSVMSGMLSVEQASSLLTWSCNVPDTTETIDSKIYLTSLLVDALGNTTKNRRNGLGHTLQSVDQGGNISTVQYDAGGNAIVSRDPNNVGQDCVYDELGRRTQCTDTVGSVTATGYDKAGQQITATDAKIKVTHYAFDARGRRWKETDRLTYPTEWSYDAAGNLLSLKDAENQITAYGYNDAGQRITEQYPDHIAGSVIGDAGYGVITFTYDALGRRTVKEDQQGDTTSFNFDMAGRMLTRVYVGHPTSPLAGQTDTDTFTYDRNGRMLSGMKGRYNNTVTFSYDDRGQQIQETLTTHGQTYTVGHQKNALGQTMQLQYPDGSLVDRAYTNRGQLQSVNYTPLAGTSSSVATFTYDGGGRETQRDLGNGLTTTRGYFANNQIQSIATPTVETLTYTYDPNKNPTSETRSGVMAPYSWTTGPTGYDDEDRLTNWSRTNGDSQTWNLSPVHEWNSTTINGSVQTRTHGPAHEILTMTGAEVSQSPAALQHDTKGNMTTDDRGCSMAWDFDNMLMSFSANGVTGLSNATYEYDAIGRRVAKNVAQSGAGTSTTLFVQAGHQVACEYSPGTPATECERKYAYGKYIDEVLIYTNLSNIPCWLHSNRQYSGYSVSNASGTALQFYSYDSTGERFEFNSSANQPSLTIAAVNVAYTGRTIDDESHFYQFRSRMYCAREGRFLSIDPSKYSDGQSLFANYFGLQKQDPSGMASRPQVENGTLVYSTGCGWIDWTHAGISDEWVKTDRFSEVWKAISEAVGSGKSEVCYSQKQGIGPLTSGYKECFWFQSPLDEEQKKCVAWSIFTAVSEGFEEHQNTYGKPWNNSGFSTEDLMSDLILFMRITEGYTREDIESFCKVWNHRESTKCLFDQFPWDDIETWGTVMKVKAGNPWGIPDNPYPKELKPPRGCFLGKGVYFGSLGGEEWFENEVQVDPLMLPHPHPFGA